MNIIIFEKTMLCAPSNNKICDVKKNFFLFSSFLLLLNDNFLTLIVIYNLENDKLANDRLRLSYIFNFLN